MPADRRYRDPTAQGTVQAINASKEPVSPKHTKAREYAHPYKMHQPESYKPVKQPAIEEQLPKPASPPALPAQTKVKPKRIRKAVHAGRVPTLVPASKVAFDKLPEDVYFEVFKHISYTGLLSLYRVNKRLQICLASSWANQYWDCATERPRGLPPCPPDMTRGDYATLMTLYSRRRRCGHDHTRKKVIKNFHLRIQYCRDYYKRLVMNAVEADAWLAKQKYGGAPLGNLTPAIPLDKIKEWATWDKNKSIHPQTKKPMHLILTLSDVEDCVFSVHLARKILTSYFSAKREAQDHPEATWRNLYDQAKENAVADWENWEAVQTAEAALREKSGATMFKWTNKARHDALQVAAPLRKAHKQARIQWIEKNLKEKHGCHPKDFPRYDAKWLQILHNACPKQAMNDFTWSLLWPTLEGLVDQHRITRLRKEKRARRHHLLLQGQNFVTAYIWENETDLPEAIRSLTGPTDEEFLKHPASKAYYVSETPMAHLKSEATKGLTNIVRDWFVKRVAELNPAAANGSTGATVGDAMEVDQLAPGNASNDVMMAN